MQADGLKETQTSRNIIISQFGKEKEIRIRGNSISYNPCIPRTVITSKPYLINTKDISVTPQTHSKDLDVQPILEIINNNIVEQSVIKYPQINFKSIKIFPMKSIKTKRKNL